VRVELGDRAPLGPRPPSHKFASSKGALVMASSTLDSTGEYEFNESQNELIGSLARKMTLVGLVMLIFGVLQMVNGTMTFVVTRDPDRVLAAAEQAGMTEAQIAQLKEAMSGGFWSSPLAVSSLAVALSGLFLLMVGLWTRQAGTGFSGIVQTRGRDVSRLMDALAALNRKYALMYAVLLAAAIIALASLAISLWHTWRGGA
jgi:hypothetical protein